MSWRIERLGGWAAVSAIAFVVSGHGASAESLDLKIGALLEASGPLSEIGPPAEKAVPIGRDRRSPAGRAAAALHPLPICRSSLRRGRIVACGGHVPQPKRKRPAQGFDRRKASTAAKHPAASSPASAPSLFRGRPGARCGAGHGEHAANLRCGLGVAALVESTEHFLLQPKYLPL